MTENELGKSLKDMYENAPRGYQVANIHLFMVKYVGPVPGTISEDAEVVCRRILIYQDFQRTPFKKRGNLYLVQSKKFRKLIFN